MMKNKEEQKKYRQEYYQKNRDSIRSKQKQYWEKNKDYRRERSYISNLKHFYNMSKEEYDFLLNKQNDKCAICKKKCRIRLRLGVDHCHETDTIRGLLCLKCNTALGMLEDNIDLFKNAIDYLKEHTID